MKRKRLAAYLSLTLVLTVSLPVTINVTIVQPRRHHAHKVRMPKPLPGPTTKVVWHPFPGDEPYRGECGQWSLKPACVLIDSPAAA